MRVIINDGKEEKEVYPIDVKGWVSTGNWGEGSLKETPFKAPKKVKEKDVK